MSETEHRADRFERLRSLPYESLRDTASSAASRDGSALDPSADRRLEEASAPPADTSPPSFVEVVYDPPAPEITIRLRYPFRLGDTFIWQVTIQPPRFDHVEAVLAGRLTRQAMYAEMTNLTEAAFGALRWPDAQRIVGVCADLAPE